MRFFATIAALALAATVSAQDSTSVEPTATSASLTPQQTCLAACDPTDICCSAACVNVPCPNEAQVNATTECAGQCTQGNGTEEETAAYASCQSSCISSNYLSTTTGGAAAATNAASSATNTADITATSGSSSATSSGAEETGSSLSSSASGSAASASSTGNAATEMRATIAGAGLFGLIIAGLAL